MSNRKKNLPEYLSFTRKERVGLICAVAIMMTAPLTPYLLFILRKKEAENHKTFEKEIAQLKIQEQDSNREFKSNTYKEYAPYNEPSGRNNDYNAAKGELFYFDPNTLSVEGWVKLGIREKTAITIQKYTSKGGHFYKPEDISKIWGLHEDEVKRLLPYVKIEVKPATDYNKYSETEKGKIYEKPKYSLVPVDINNSDTAAFIALPGIGSKLAARIVAFREKLGGFYKTEQIAETYGLPDSTFQKIRPRLVISNSNVKKLNINTAFIDELKAHPYLRYNLANAILQYRTQHGSFSSVADIKNIMLITEDIYNKAAPYLTVK